LAAAAAGLVILLLTMLVVLYMVLVEVAAVILAPMMLVRAGLGTAMWRVEVVPLALVELMELMERRGLLAVVMAAAAVQRVTGMAGTGVLLVEVLVVGPVTVVTEGTVLGESAGYGHGDE
jgi:hypothetical protein